MKIKCPVCGNKNDSKNVFCGKCGNQIEQQASGRKEVYAGKVVKCPNCGETLKTFDMVCPSCNYELRTNGASGAVNKLSETLQRIDSGKGGIVKNLVKGELFVKAYEKKMSAIENFVVPNNKEDIIELMIMATSNIYPPAYNELYSSELSEKEKKQRRLLSDAWISKYNQALQKAMISFPEDEQLSSVQRAYEMKMIEVKKEKGKSIKLIVAICLGLVLIILFCFIMSAF